MGCVYQRTQSRRVPDEAEISGEGDDKIATWRGRNGRKKVGKLYRSQDGSTRIRTKSSYYTVKYRDGSGEQQIVNTKCRTRQAAQKILSDLEARAERVRSGIITASEDAVADWLISPIAESLTDWLHALEARQRSRTHIADMRRLTNKLVRECGFQLIRDINAVAIERWLDERVLQGVSPRTRNSYLMAIRGLCRWCVSRGRLLADPTASITKLNEEVDRRLRRRAMTAAEMNALLYVAQWRPIAEAGRLTIRRDATEGTSQAHRWTYVALTPENFEEFCRRGEAILAADPKRLAKLRRRGRERMLIYLTFLSTGLRRGELKSIRLCDVRLDEAMPVIELRAASAKNRKASKIPLRQELAEELCRWIEDEHGAQAAPDTKLFKIPAHLLMYFNRDLAAAGIPKKDDRGYTLDIHSLRHTFGSMLSAVGVAPRTAQAAMRHSSIDLTMNIYTDPRVLDIAAAIQALPRIWPHLPGPMPKSGDTSAAEGFTAHEGVGPKNQFEGYMAPISSLNPDFDAKTGLSLIHI